MAENIQVSKDKRPAEKSFWQRCVGSGTYLFFLLLLIEVALRFQQKIGPLSDLEFRDITLGTISETLNHTNVPGKLFVSGDEIDELKGQKLLYEFDENGIRINRLQPEYPKGTRVFKVLFMGDSFMEGYESENTIPQGAWDIVKSGKLKDVPLIHINAGCMSYSPAIMVAQAKKILPIYKPDIVVVDIDETDLGDDYIRYKDLIVRDDSGSIIAVRPTPIFYENIIGYLRMKTVPFYTVRLMMKIHHKVFHMRSIIREYRKRDARMPLSISADKSPDARTKYRTEIDFFERNVSDLVETLMRYSDGDRGRILLLYHPHIEHLNPASDGTVWNNFVSETLAKVAEKYGVQFYDATEDIKVSSVGSPEKLYFKRDMHFNYDGMKVYGTLVGRKLEPIIEKYFHSGSSV